MKKTLFLALCVPSLAFGAIDVQQFDNPQQESDYRALIQELRCPQCQNNNIADSNATISADMRDKTLALLKQGKSKDEVVAYMVERYGNFVTYDPPITPATIMLWVLPLLLILGGIGVMFMRKPKRAQAVEKTENFAKAEQDRLNQILNEEEK